MTPQLPHSPVLLEASAGTGKTHRIADYAVAYIADGMAISELLILTFGRQAAGELRSRVFQQLQQAHAKTTGVEHERLGRAVQEFDTAVITTLDAFALTALTELGVLGDWDPGDTLIPDASDLIQDCAADVYLQRYQNAQELPIRTNRYARIAERAATSSLPLVPVESEEAQFASGVRAAFAERKKALSVATFADLSARLRALVADPVAGPTVTAELRRRFRVTMIDEFQDTDPDQWAILQHAFLRPDYPLVLIGDPKQSIYGFRNADLTCYLEAARSELVTTQHLDRNWRSDPQVVHAVAELFGNITLGAPEIHLVEVKPERQRRFWLNRKDQAGIWIRTVAPSETHGAEAQVDASLVRHVQLLLADGTIQPSPDSAPTAVSEDDVVVLVRTSARGRAIVRQLQGAGIAAVLSGASNVWTSEAAQEWLQVLGSVASLERSDVMLAAATRLLQIDFARLVHDDGTAFAEASATIHAMRNALLNLGPGAMTSVLMTQPGALETWMSGDDGERFATDAQHIAELLSAAEVRDPVALREWAKHQIASGSEAQYPQRIASDQPAVRVMTLHAAKGSQFPIVLLPQVSNTDIQAWLPFPLINADGQRELWVGPTPGRGSEQERRLLTQSRDEELRLLYVGLTRAKHLAVAWHVMDETTQTGPLTALLARDRSTQTLQLRYPKLPSSFTFDPQLVDVRDAKIMLPPLPPRPEQGTQLTLGNFTRAIDHIWRRTSYSGLTNALHHGPGIADEPDLDTLPELPVGSEQISPMAHLPAGPAFGTVVHAALEEIDWTPENLARSAREQATRLAPLLGGAEEVREELEQALTLICTTPLGEVGQGITLSQVKHHFAELDFDLAMAASGGATVARLGEAMAKHLAPDDPLAAYPARLLATDASSAVLRGVLTGSIDAVLQLPNQSFLVVDYKTNRFPTAEGQELTVGHYHAAAMAEAMMEAHYPLQALLYGAALHRFLAWRLPDYAPTQHLAGVAYLFVRGMAGPSTPTLGGMPAGVFTWQPPAELFVEAADIVQGDADA